MNITPEDEQDDGFEIISAERRLAAHQAFARQEAAFEPGPRRVRRLREPAQQWHDEMMATCPFDLRANDAA